MVAQLIKKLWNITQQLWSHYNNALHTICDIHTISILIPLKASITIEYALGQDELPSLYSYTINLSPF